MLDQTLEIELIWGEIILYLIGLCQVQLDDLVLLRTTVGFDVKRTALIAQDLVFCVKGVEQFLEVERGRQ